MTDPRTEPTRPESTPEQASDATPEPTLDQAPAATPEPTPEQAAEATPQPPLEETFEQRMEDFGRRAEAAGERWGRQAEATGERWSKDPAVVGAADTAGRVWGVLVLAIGLWFLADVTLGMDMPAIAWRDLWPVALIAVGLAVVLRGLSSRRT